MTEHATPNTTRPSADLFEIIRTTQSMRRVKSAGIPKWGPSSLNSNPHDALAGDAPGPRTRHRPARGKSGRAETVAEKCGRPPSPTATRKGKAVPDPSVPRPTRGKPGPAGRGVRKLEIRSQAQGRFSDARRATW